jgi:hypothetical protein
MQLRGYIFDGIRESNLGGAGHCRLGAAFQAAKRCTYRLYARGKNVLWVDNDSDTDALQLRVAGHEVLAGGRGDREHRPAVTGGDAGTHLVLRLRRVKEEDVCLFGDERLDPRQCLVEAAGNTGIGTRQQENA